MHVCACVCVCVCVCVFVYMCVFQLVPAWGCVCVCVFVEGERGWMSGQGPVIPARCGTFQPELSGAVWCGSDTALLNLQPRLEHGLKHTGVRTSLSLPIPLSFSPSLFLSSSLSLALSVAFTLHSSPVHPFILYLLTQSLSSPPLLWFCFCSASFQSFPLSIQRWDSSLSVSFSFLPPALSNKHRGASSEHCLLCQHTHTHKCIHTHTQTQTFVTITQAPVTLTNLK